MKLLTTLVGCIVLCACGPENPPTTSSAGSTGSVEATERILLGDDLDNSDFKKAPLWGAAFDVRRPGCQGDMCFAAVAFRFVRYQGKIGVQIQFKNGKEGYEAYKKGQRYLGDDKPDNEGKAWVVIRADGSFIAENRFKWSCRPPTPTQVQCVRIPFDGLDVPYTMYLMR